MGNVAKQTLQDKDIRNFAKYFPLKQDILQEPSKLLKKY